LKIWNELKFCASTPRLRQAANRWQQYVKIKTKATMKLKIISSISFLIIGFKINAQSIEGMKLSDKEIPENYSLTEERKCISIQACTLYEKPGIYEMFIGKLKNKSVQNFENTDDKGSILYFEFKDGFKGKGFLDGLLWGGDSPTKDHPEEYYAKGNFLVIWSFKTGSALTKTSKEKVIKALK
jgi:hypothetical protein